jgi:hypothetical protein
MAASFSVFVENFGVVSLLLILVFRVGWWNVDKNCDNLTDMNQRFRDICRLCP